MIEATGCNKIVPHPHKIRFCNKPIVKHRGHRQFCRQHWNDFNKEIIIWKIKRIPRQIKDLITIKKLRFMILDSIATRINEMNKDD